MQGGRSPNFCPMSSNRCRGSTESRRLHVSCRIRCTVCVCCFVDTCIQARNHNAIDRCRGSKLPKPSLLQRPLGGTALFNPFKTKRLWTYNFHATRSPYAKLTLPPGCGKSGRPTSQTPIAPQTPVYGSSAARILTR